VSGGLFTAHKLLSELQLDDLRHGCMSLKARAKRFANTQPCKFVN